MMLRPSCLVLVVAAAVTIAVGPARGQDGTSIEAIESPPGDHWVWVTDFIFRHSVLFDGDDGRVLGMIDTAVQLAAKPPYVSRERGEVYTVDSVWSRGYRGERTDVVTVWDAARLEVVGEVVIPPRAADTGLTIALAAVLDGGRFLVVFNQTPSSSVSVVDLESRSFAGEIETAGCAGVYATGPQSFTMLCGDGSALLVTLDDAGREVSTTQSESFFEPIDDPLDSAGVRRGDRWLFVSYDGYVHEVDFSGEKPRLDERWSMFTDAERDAAWRVGGFQQLALHDADGRLFAVVHQGGRGTHKDPGPELWVYGLETRARSAVFDAPNLLPAFLRPHLGFEADSFAYWLLGLILPSAGIHSVAVTQDDEPLLFVRNGDLGAVGVLDARTGEHLRDLEEAGLGGRVLTVP